MSLLDDILENNKTWFQLFDIIRIIETGGTHRVVSCYGSEEFDEKIPCYCFWGRDSHCANCVSKRADSKQKPIMKLEYRNNQYYCVIAKPIEVNNTKYILELIMNISNQINNDEEDTYIKKYMLDITERLENASTKDSFTELYNKVYMEEVYDKYVNDNQRKHVYMALLDLDYFKEINDNYGHDCGDKVLLNVANLLESTIKDMGIVARFGGDEFGIVFESENEEECIKLLDRVKEEIGCVEYTSETVTFKADISYGVADVKETSSFYEAIHEVDKKLYQVKHKENR